MMPNGNAIQLLTYAFAALEHGSLRQAARALNVQESCVSRSVAKLEQLLGMQLFDRDVHGMRLTEAGRAWVDIVRVHYEGLVDAFSGCVREHQDVSTLRIGLCCVTAGEFLQRLIRRFGKVYPGVRLAIEDIPTGQCFSAIRRRRLDIAFTHDLGTLTTCHSEVFWQERLFVLLASRHALAEMPSVTWSDLSNMCLLVPAGLEGPPMDRRLLERIATHGAPAVQRSRATHATIIFKVQLGQGVALAEESYAKSVAVDRAMWKPLEGQNSVSSIRGLWLESNPKRALLRFVALAKKMAQETGLGCAKGADVAVEPAFAWPA